MKLAKLFNEFFNSEKACGLILVCATLLSIFITNTSLQSEYLHFWGIKVAGHSITHWINDGLMAIFFLLIGLELEREVYTGELSNLKNASLPFLAAAGGMIVPALLYYLFNVNTPAQSGAGIPTATDIAFAIGILSLLGKRVPPALKIFLTALAVVDDLGAIIVIAIFYAADISFTNLFIALGVFAILLILKRFKVLNLIPYLAGGVAMWYFMLHSGVHSSIAGVLLAFAIPFGDGSEKSPSYLLQHWLHKPVSFIILPLFAIANACIVIQHDWFGNLFTFSSAGIIAGLVIGKPLGISLFSFIAVKTGISNLPADISWKNIIGTGFLGGIGFTMSIFITLLAFKDLALIDNTKIAILISSLIAAVTGFIVLKNSFKNSDKIYK
jgi:NhaA family Na+:H+ antiporter